MSRGTVSRASQLFLPTLREDPAEAEAASHRLLLRSGCVRQVGAGLYAFMPLGWRVYKKVEQIIREEMDAIGCQEMLMPLLTPAELWQRTGRYEINELFKVSDRADRPFVLAMTHEETITFLAREISSYRQLPQLWYHFGLKERDEPRPRAGLLRVREFVMKDSYSFDRDQEGLDVSYAKHAAAYRAAFDRLGLRYYEVESDTGMMGGTGAHEYMAPCEAGENDVARCEACGYAANVEVAASRPTAPDLPQRRNAPEEVETPGATTIESLAALLGIDPRATAKAMPVVGPDGQLVLGLVRGDHRLHELKLRKVLGGDFRPAHPEEIREAFGADGGSLGPVGVSLPIVADEALREGWYVTGANRNGWHLLGVEAGRDFEPGTWADIREAQAGDGCPRCDGTLSVEPAIEVGNIFKLGTRYSEALGATYLDEAGVERPIVMGSYGIGPGRTLAAIVEQCHDDRGIVWPAQIAPYDVHLVEIGAAGPEAAELADLVARECAAAGLSVLLDDRDQRPGEKFADADLIGCPVRVTVGKKALEDGQVDVKRRASGEEARVPASQVAAAVSGAA
ncbi:MAG: proline--tRNA ligase [Thermoleophilia bacterium]